MGEWENANLDDLTQAQRNLLRDLQRHGTMSGVPSRTYSRLDLSRLSVFDDPDPIPDFSEQVLPEPDSYFLDLGESAVQEATENYLRRQEGAILSTEWDEWDIVDIVEWTPVTPSDLPEFEVHRYEGTAPPVGDYATGEQRYSVTRVTRPLLERVFRELRENDALPERYEKHAEELL